MTRDTEAQAPFVAPKRYSRIEHSNSAIVDKGRNLFPVLSTVGTFGASIALASFYSARQLSDDSRTLALLAWAYTAYAVATVTTLVWQLALLTNIWVAPRRIRFFRSERGILLALGLSILSIASGTVLISLALLQPPSTPHGVVISAYTATGAIAFIILFTLLRFLFVWTRRTSERGHGFVILPNNLFKKPEPDDNDDESKEIGDFLDMYCQHGERLARLYELPSMRGVSDQDAAEMLYLAGVALQYEERRRPTINPTKQESEVAEIKTFIDHARRWQKTLDMLNAFDKGHFYRRPRNEQVWRFKILLGHSKAGSDATEKKGRDATSSDSS